MELKKCLLYRIPSKILHKTYFWLKKLANTVYYQLKFKGDFILIDCWAEQWFGKIMPRNFGDELNFYLLEILSGKNIVNATNTLFRGTKYLFIGSIIEKRSTPDSIIWGSGAIEGHPRELDAKPRSVLAIRGKLTKKYLEDYGVACPDIYGDPALLLPMVYAPKIEKKYQLGIIPHFSEIHHPIVEEFVSANKDEVHLISLENYGDWHTVIDEILSCKYIVSSSLHGLIIADAYGIPNIWLNISGNLLGGEFKFRDYFSGVERNYSPPFALRPDTQTEELYDLLRDFSPIHFDPEKLLSVCPFNRQ